MVVRLMARKKAGQSAPRNVDLSQYRSSEGTGVEMPAIPTDEERLAHHDHAIDSVGLLRRERHREGTAEVVGDEVDLPRDAFSLEKLTDERGQPRERRVEPLRDTRKTEPREIGG